MGFNHGNYRITVTVNNNTLYTVHAHRSAAIVKFKMNNVCTRPIDSQNGFYSLSLILYCKILVHPILSVIGTKYEESSL